jgi:hypothetical protein
MIGTRLVGDDCEAGSAPYAPSRTTYRRHADVSWSADVTVDCGVQHTKRATFFEQRIGGLIPPSLPRLITSYASRLLGAARSGNFR